jgi:catechol 2,3-dioxygenase-like lactoylglutathione lyase family enzyme
MKGISGIRHVVYGHTDLKAAEQFLVDFGLQPAVRAENRIYFRGAGPKSYVYVAQLEDTSGFRALAFEVDSMDVLKRLAETPGASKVEPIEAPGGGHRVVLHDPDGFRIEMVHGIPEVEPLPMREPLTLNYARVKNRHGGTQRAPLGPAQILRLGHVALAVSNFPRALNWYREILGMIPSDILFDGSKDNQVGGFMRLDRGQEWVDHHTIALFQSSTGAAKTHHSSFEVQDLDAQALGNKWMLQQGHKHYWGIGRHVIGSQIFDYWKDPSGNMVEHYADGDLFQADVPTGFAQASLDVLYQWGPQVPQEFLP